MKIKSLTSVYIILIIGIAYASMLILRHGVQPIDLSHNSSLDSYVVGATMMEYNKLGELKSKIIAKKIEHFESKQHTSTLFIKPDMLAYAEDRTPWHIVADQATANKTGDIIFMQGHVIFHEYATKVHPEMTIKTTEMTLYPKQSLGKTKAPVVIERPDGVIHGKGLIANFKTGQYQLQSESEATYLPNSTSRSTPSRGRQPVMPTQ